jgi:hypothetical protein
LPFSSRQSNQSKTSTISRVEFKTFSRDHN